MKRTILLLLSIFFLNSCIPILRSSRGLEKRQMKISYIAPLYGDIRYGITDHFEYRLLFMDAFETDIMYHNNINSAYYAFALGTMWVPDDFSNILPTKSNFEGVGFTSTLSQKINERFFPYIGLSFFKDYHNNDNSTFFVIGFDYYISQKGKNSIVLTPELEIFPNQLEYEISAWPSLAIGIQFGL